MCASHVEGASALHEAKVRELPESLKRMKRDETVCKCVCCGVSSPCSCSRPSPGSAASVTWSSVRSRRSTRSSPRLTLGRPSMRCEWGPLAAAGAGRGMRGMTSRPMLQADARRVPELLQRISLLEATVAKTLRSHDEMASAKDCMDAATAELQARGPFNLPSPGAPCSPPRPPPSSPVATSAAVRGQRHDAPAGRGAGGAAAPPGRAQQRARCSALFGRRAGSDARPRHQLAHLGGVRTRHGT